VNVRTTVPPPTMALPKSVWSAGLGVASPSEMLTLLPVTLISGAGAVRRNTYALPAFTPAAVSSKMRPDQRGVTRQRYGTAEPVTLRPVASGQFGLLAPIRAAAHKQIRAARTRPRRRVALSITMLCAYHANIVKLSAAAITKAD